jgi:hypothetical protein
MTVDLTRDLAPDLAGERVDASADLSPDLSPDLSADLSAVLRADVTVVPDSAPSPDVGIDSGVGAVVVRGKVALPEINQSGVDVGVLLDQSVSHVVTDAAGEFSLTVKSWTRPPITFAKAGYHTHIFQGSVGDTDRDMRGFPISMWHSAVFDAARQYAFGQPFSASAGHVIVHVLFFDDNGTLAAANGGEKVTLAGRSYGAAGQVDRSTSTPKWITGDAFAANVASSNAYVFFFNVDSLASTPAMLSISTGAGDASGRHCHIVYQPPSGLRIVPDSITLAFAACLPTSTPFPPDWK